MQPSLKPFKPGDLSGDAEGPRTGDVNLQACVAAAERAMRAHSMQVRRSSHLQTCPCIRHQARHASAVHEYASFEGAMPAHS